MRFCGKNHRNAIGDLCLSASASSAAGGCTNFVSNRSNADGVTLFQRGQYQEALAISGGHRCRSRKCRRLLQPRRYLSSAGPAPHGKERLSAQAEKNYRQCLDKNPNHRDCHRGLAVLLIEENRATEAFASIQTWAAQSPSLPEPRMELARLYEEFRQQGSGSEHSGRGRAAEPRRSEAVGRNGQGPRRDG